jgi:Sad1 / UNC-like C-terminal
VLRVLNNWGQAFTCLYRFRVHGRMVDLPAGESTVPGAEKIA